MLPRFFLCCSFFMLCCFEGFGDFIIINEPCTVKTEDGSDADLPGGTVLNVVGMRSGFYVAGQVQDGMEKYLVPSANARVIGRKIRDGAHAFGLCLESFAEADLEEAETMCRVAVACNRERLLYSLFLSEVSELRSAIGVRAQGAQRYSTVSRDAAVSYKNAGAIKNSSLLDKSSVDAFGSDSRAVLAKDVKKQADRERAKAERFLAATDERLRKSLAGFSNLARRSYNGGRFDVAFAVSRGVHKLVVRHGVSNIDPPLNEAEETNARAKIEKADAFYRTALAYIEGHRLVAADDMLKKALDEFPLHPYAGALKTGVEKDLADISDVVEEAGVLRKSGRGRDAADLLAKAVKKCVDFNPLTSLYAEVLSEINQD